MKRPHLSKVQRWYWKDQHGNSTPGIILRKGPHIAAHLTPAEAIDLSNRLVDLAEKMEMEATP